MSPVLKEVWCLSSLWLDLWSDVCYLITSSKGFQLLPHGLMSFQGKKHPLQRSILPPCVSTLPSPSILASLRAVPGQEMSEEQIGQQAVAPLSDQSQGGEGWGSEEEENLWCRDITD